MTDQNRDLQKRDLRKQGTKDSLEGKAQQVAGHMKDAAGGLTGKVGLQAEGKKDEIVGNVKDKLGKVERDAGNRE